jgi:hypothetical protein
VFPSCEEQFNAKAISEYLEQYNITMTSGDKTNNMDWKSIGEFTFLRNRTGTLFGRYVPLAWNPMEQTNWIRKGEHAEDPEVACENNCNSALRAVFFYGYEAFEKARNSILFVRPNYNLINFFPLKEEFMEVGCLVDTSGAFTFGVSRMPASTVLKKSIDPIIDVIAQHSSALFTAPSGLPPHWNLKLATEEQLLNAMRGVIYDDDQFGIPNIPMLINNLMYYRKIKGDPMLGAIATGHTLSIWCSVPASHQNIRNLTRMCDAVLSMTFDLYYDHAEQAGLRFQFEEPRYDECDWC